jgi:two-component system OmpR family response regulator
MTTSRPKRILLVEDEEDALELMQWWVEEQGFDVRTARTGEAALDIGRSFKPDFLVTDYLLQDDLTGADVIDELRNANGNVRCVLVTGLLQNALSRDAQRLDGVPILTKPFDFKRLGALLSSAGAEADLP